METIKQAQEVQRQREAKAASSQNDKNTSYVGHAFNAVSGRLENTVKSFFINKNDKKSAVTQTGCSPEPEELTIDLTQDRPVVSRGSVEASRIKEVEEITLDIPDADAFLLGSSDSIKQGKLSALSTEAKIEMYKGLKVVLNAATLQDIVTVTPGPIVHLYREVNCKICVLIIPTNAFYLNYGMFYIFCSNRQGSSRKSRTHGFSAARAAATPSALRPRDGVLSIHASCCPTHCQNTRTFKSANRFSYRWS